LSETVRLLAELTPQDGRVLVGGQSLVPIMGFRLARPAHLIDINAVAGLDVLAIRDEILHIGALARHAAFHRPVQDGPLGAMLASVVRHIAPYPIRLRGTFSGSLAHADPAAEWCLVAATDLGRRAGCRQRSRRGAPCCAILLPGRHGNGARARRVACRDAAADPAGRYPFRL